MAMFMIHLLICIIACLKLSVHIQSERKHHKKHVKMHNLLRGNQTVLYAYSNFSFISRLH